MEKEKIAIIGLGYVGLPLAIEFGKKYPVIGYDINKDRVEGLNIERFDYTGEAEKEDIENYLNSNNIFTYDQSDIAEASVFIVTVPTPIDSHKKPNLSHLINASKTISKNLKKGDIVIYESTVYPGCTEEVCVPALEENTTLKYNTDFFVGYSPERINPGDKKNTVRTITKVTSGCNPKIAQHVDFLYKSIGINTHLAPSIKVAEASKAIENAQRDLNISFANELALLFDRLEIDTNDVLDAAGTKWNFLKFKPGLVGGHCISVDPYYLIYKAEEVGYHPQVIHSGRRVNDYMPTFVANKLIKEMIRKRVDVYNPRILVLGVTFKENVPDIRNSKVIDVINELKSFKTTVDVFDPFADPNELIYEYGIDVISEEKYLPNLKYDAILFAVGHTEFKYFDFDRFKKNNCVIFDLKNFLPKNMVDIRL